MGERGRGRERKGEGMRGREEVGRIWRMREEEGDIRRKREEIGREWGGRGRGERGGCRWIEITREKDG